MNRLLPAGAFCALLLQACGEPLVAPELIVNTRVLGARVESATDPTRAWPAPAEGATVRWLLANPDGAPKVGWAFSLCTAKPVSRGLPLCEGSPFAHRMSEGTSTDAPQFEFAVPDLQSLGGATEVVVRAAFCTSGTPAFSKDGVDFASTRCPNATNEPLLATTEIPLWLTDATNHVPTFDAVSFGFDGAPWTGITDAEEQSVDCIAGERSIPTVPADGTTHDLALAIPTELSESLPSSSAPGLDRETLQLSHYVTGGDLERAFSSVSLDAPSAKVAVAWTAPIQVDAGGRLLRFYFILRDGRGGTAWAKRTLCVVP